MAKRFGFGTTRRLVMFFGLAACLTGFSWLLLAQDTAPPGYRAYSLKHAEPSEVIPRLEQMLAEMGAQPEILVDRGTNRILVRGTANAQKLAVELIETLDRPAANKGTSQDPQSPVVARGYRVGSGSLEKAQAELRAKFPPSTGVRVAADERTGQLVVVASEETHRRIIALFGGANQRSNGSAAAPAANGPTRQLKHVTWRELEDGLGRIWGKRLSRTTNRDGELAIISVISETETQPMLHIDRRRNSVTYLGPPTFSQTWEQILGTLDRPEGSDNQQTAFVALGRADPAKVHRAVSLVQIAARQEQDAASRAAARPNGGRPDQVVSAIFHPRAQAAAADAPAEPPKPAAKPPAPKTPAAKPDDGAAADAGADAAAADDMQDIEDGGLLGPVDIQVLEGQNVIVLRGHKRDVERVREIIEQIRTISEETQPVIEVYSLNFVGSQVLAELATEMYDQMLSPRQGPVSIRPLVNPNALLLIGARESVDVVRKLIARLDQPVEPNTQFEVFHLKNISSVDAEETIRRFFSDGLGTAQQAGQTTGSLRPGLGTRVNVVSNFVNNTLIVHASPRDMVEVRRLIAEIDVETGGAANEVKIFRLKNALSTDVAPVLQDALNWRLTGRQIPFGAQGTTGAFGGGGFGAQTQEQARLRSAILTFMTIDSAEGTKVLESGLMSDVRVTADANGNALVVTGPSKSMGLIEALVKELDTLPSAKAQIKVFTIVNGDASALSSMLQQLLAQQAQGSTQALSTLFGQGAINPFLQPSMGSAASIGESSLVPIRFGVDQRTNSIIASGSEGDLGVVEAILLRLDEDSFRAHKTAVYWLANAPAVDVAASLNTWLDERDQLFADQLTISPESPDIQWNRQVIVVPEAISNSIIISAVPGLFDEVKHVVESLDRSLPLIKIDVLIAEVALTDIYEFGAEFGLQDSLLFDRTTLAGSPVGFNFNNQALGDLGAVRNTLGAQALSNFAVGRESGEGYGGLVLSASKDSLSVLIRALQEDGRIQILSRPQVATIDKQPATVFVGENTARPGASSQNASTTTTSVNYEDVGLQLLVTPQVNPDGTVKMDIEATKSRIDFARSVEIDGNTIPNIVTVNAVATISAASGQTVVFAGLIQTDKQQELRGIPFISRLPVIGPLLSYTEDRDVRQELLIIMTPHVIHDNDEDQTATIRYAESERMSWCLADVVDIYGDVGMSARPGWWCEGEWQHFRRAPVIFPAVNPTGLEPTPLPVPIADDGELDLPPLPVEPSSSRRTHETDVDTTNQAAMGVAPIPSASSSYYRPDGPHRRAYPDAPAAYEGPPRAAAERQAAFNAPREQPGVPPHGALEGRIQYQTTPETRQTPKRMPMAQ